MRGLLLASSVTIVACGDPTPSQTSSSAKSSQDPPRLEIPYLDGAVTIDGALAEPIWQSAATTGTFVNVGNGQPAPDSPVRGSARLFWNATHLYVAFEIQDATVRGGFPANAIDPHLWERDTAEIMIDPDGDGDNRDYYEIQVNPQNLVFDSQFDDYNQPRKSPAGPFGHQDWSSAIQSAVQIRGTLDDDSDNDNGYTIEARIPFSSFTKAKQAPPKPGDAWRVNFYAMQDNGGVAWSPILGKGNFHRASRFGHIVFGAP